MASASDSSRSKGGAAFRWKAIGVGLLVIVAVYLGYLFYMYSLFHGRDIHYPRDVLKRLENAPPVAEDRPAAGTAVAAADGPAPGSETAAQCGPSRTVAVQVALVEFLVRRNAWVPARPLYKLGFFGLVDFADTPFFDNKASEQLGILDISRRLAIELTDSLGRIRGTSEENEDLMSAQSALRIDEGAWFVNNPLNASVNTISPSAASSYEKAIPLYTTYNADLARCEALFDTRADNLRETLSRFTATLGATTTELIQQSRKVIYDVQADRFVPGPGSNAAWFDFRADNTFYRARGKMYALHGLLKGMRHDFHSVLSDKNVHAVWDKMEQAVAEAALLSPMVVSNGPADALVAPNHLAVMGEMMLRARTSMVEVRDILVE